MRTTSTITTVTAFAAAVLVGLGAPTGVAADASPDREAAADRLVRQAQNYVGDPWEQRFRDQFWARQHIHDSWNRCHLGENAPRPAGCDGTSLTPHR